MIFEKIKKKLSYEKYIPLVYSKELIDAYQGVSVAGGNLKGKTVLVTGATGDLGCSLAKRFIVEGCIVCISGRNQKKLDETRNELEKQYPYANIKTVCFDLLDKQSIISAINNLEKENYRIDVLISNAGVFFNEDRRRVFRSYNKNQMEKSWKTNFEGNAIVCKCLAEHMKNNCIFGKIIIIASICAKEIKTQYTPYGFSKTAIIEYGNQLQKEYPDLDIMSILPGSLVTKMGDLGIGSNITRKENRIKRFIIPEEVASISAFLCSDDSKYFKGTQIRVAACEVF